MSDSVMAGRWRIQMLAAMIHLFLRAPDGSKPNLTNADCLALADAELTSMMFTDIKLQAEAEEEAERLVHDQQVMEHRLKYPV